MHLAKGDKRFDDSFRHLLVSQRMMTTLSLKFRFQAGYLLLLVILLIGCRQEAAGEFDSNSTAPTTIIDRPTGTATPIKDRPTGTPASIQLEQEGSQQTLSIEPTAVFTPTMVTPPGLDLGQPVVPCGSILPLVSSEENDSTSPSFSNLDIPDDLIPEAARPALERIISAPEMVGLAAFQIGYETEGLYLNADSPMPLASVVKIINLIAYAEAVEAGELDPAAWIPVLELERFYLPGQDLGAHPIALLDLQEQGLVAGDPPAIPLEEIASMMIQHSSNAASDYLHFALGQTTIESTAQKLDLQSQTAPCPWIGQFLAMNNHTRSGNNLTAVESYIDDPDLYAQEVMVLAEAFANDPLFRQTELESPKRWSQIDTQGLTELESPRRRSQIDTQRLFADQLNAQGSAGDYATLMSQIIQNELTSPYVNILVRRELEWPLIYPANQELFHTVGYKNGSWAGVLTTVYYAQRLDDGAQVVVALFYRQLPVQTYRTWRRELPHDELARWLLADPNAIPLLNNFFAAGR